MLSKSHPPPALQVMGIVNINDDSFSGDGTLNLECALDMAVKQVADGADIIDIGAESARTNREPITVEEEIHRLIPFLEAFPRRLEIERLARPEISINSWRSDVIEQVLPYGIDLINDMGGLPDGDDRNARLAAESGASLLIMHTVGTPKVPHTSQMWDDVVGQMISFFGEKIAVAEAAGLSRENIVIDPGIDFAKQRDDNLRVLNSLNEICDTFDCRMLLPISRKTVIGDVLGIDDPSERDAGTIACLVSGLFRGASIFRVHNVKAVKQSLQTVEPLLKSGS